MTAQQVLAELAKLGSEQTKKTLLRHGAKEPLFGVKIGDTKPLQKKLKGDNDLALALFDTRNYDAMYLAGLVCDPPRMTKAQLKKWAKAAKSPGIAEYTVAWVAAESGHGAELAREWIDSKDELVAAAGWNTLSGVVALTPDDELDLDELADLLDRVERRIREAPNRVKYAMNGFLIAVGGYVVPLTARAKAAAKAIGPVEVDMGDTACKLPDVVGYIAKMEAAGKHGAKRKTVRC
jgi:3-methyladenine DNA glycosylase AlkD